MRFIRPIIGAGCVTIFMFAFVYKGPAQATDWDQYKYNQGQKALKQQNNTRQQVYDQIYKTPPASGNQGTVNSRQNSQSQALDMLDSILKQRSAPQPPAPAYSPPQRTYNSPPTYNPPPPTYNPPPPAPRRVPSRPVAPPSYNQGGSSSGGSGDDFDF